MGKTSFAGAMLVFGVLYYLTAPIWWPVKKYRKWREAKKEADGRVAQR